MKVRGIAAAALLVLGLGAPALAQDGGSALEKKRDEKLAEPWVKAGGWITDYDKALAESKKSGKLIFGYFTRSYAP